MPQPLDDFGKAYHELLDAPDEVIDELAAKILRSQSERARIKAARTIQQQRETERRKQ